MNPALRYQSKQGDPYSSHSIIEALAGAGDGQRLLDVGAAQGVLAETFRQRGFEVTCIEGDPALAELGRGKCQEMIVADLDGDLPILNGQFDVIVYGDVLEHLRDPGRVVRAFNRYLKPAGRVIVSVPNFVHLFVRLNVLVGRFNYMERGILDRTHLRFFTLKTFRKFLTESGLTTDEIFATPVPLPSVVPPRFHGCWLRVVHGLSAGLARLWKTMFGYQFVAVARPGGGQ